MALPTYEAEFLSGDALETMEYTPSADVDAGDVVVVGDIVGIAIRPIASGELGTLVIHGGNWKVTGAGTYTNGAIVYWDDTNNKVTTTASTHKKFGVLTSACAADGEICNAALLRSV